MTERKPSPTPALAEPAATSDQKLPAEILPMVRELARELYDRFVMGGWEPHDAYPQITEIIDRYWPRAAAPSKGMDQDILEQIRGTLFAALEMKEPSFDKCDRSAFEMVMIASNGIFWRNKEIKRLRELLVAGAAPSSVPPEIWLEFMRHNHCSLCGNAGIIDTRGITTPANFECGDLHYCICPNGRALKSKNAPKLAWLQSARASSPSSATRFDIYPWLKLLKGSCVGTSSR